MTNKYLHDIIEEGEKKFEDKFIRNKFWELVPNTPRKIMASDTDVAVMMANINSFLHQHTIDVLEAVKERIKGMNNFRQAQINDPTKQDWNDALEQSACKADALLAEIEGEIKELKNKKI